MYSVNIKHQFYDSRYYIKGCNMPVVSYVFYCVFESVMQLPNFDWEEDRQHTPLRGCGTERHRKAPPMPE